MMNLPSTSSVERKSVTKAKKRCKHCPECAKRNVQSRIRRYKLDLDSNSLRMCESAECLYPLMTKEMDDIEVGGGGVRRKTRETRRETADFGRSNGFRCSTASETQNDVAKQTSGERSSKFPVDDEVLAVANSFEPEDILRDLFLESENGRVEAEASDVASLVSMLEKVTSDIASSSDDVTARVAGTEPRNGIGTPAADKTNTNSYVSKTVSLGNGARKSPRSVSKTTKVRGGSRKVKETPKKDATPNGAGSAKFRTASYVSTVKETPKALNKTGCRVDSPASRSVCNLPTTAVPRSEVKKPAEIEMNSRNPLLRFLMTKQKGSQRSLVAAETVRTVETTVVPPRYDSSTNSKKKSVPSSKSASRTATKDANTTNRMVTNWLSSANAAGRTTFSGYQSFVKQKDDGFVSEDSGIQSPQSLQSSESEPTSIR